METFSADGSLESRSQQSKSIKGSGRLIVTDEGFRWGLQPASPGPEAGSGWKDIHTFARQGRVLSIAYLSNHDPGAEPLVDAVWFEGAMHDCRRIEEIARAHLSADGWRAPFEAEEIGRWDAIWTREWED
jgi:hypothetical protein